MDPIVAGSLISGGFQLAGGALGGMTSREMVKYQKQFAKKGIQWRVKDAKKAGLHPLYALGANVPSFSPVESGMGEALAAAGQDFGRAAAAKLTLHQRKLLDLELAQAGANLDKTFEEMAFLRSERLRNINDSFKWLPEPNVPEKRVITDSVFDQKAIPVSQGVPPNMVHPVAPDLMSHDPATNTVAGVPKGWRLFEQPSGLKIAWPTSGTDLAEAKESVMESLANMVEWYSVNKRLNPNFSWEIAAEYLPPDMVSGWRNIRRAYREGWEGFGRRIPRYDYVK